MYSGNYVSPYDLARIRGQNSCAEYLVSNYGGQRGNLLASILARRLQKSYRQYQTRIKANGKPIDTASNKHALLKQAQLCLDNKKLDDRTKIKSLNSQPSISIDDNNAQDRRRAFAKSKTAITTINQSDESR